MNLPLNCVFIFPFSSFYHFRVFISVHRDIKRSTKSERQHVSWFSPRPPSSHLYLASSLMSSNILTPSLSLIMSQPDSVSSLTNSRLDARQLFQHFIEIITSLCISPSSPHLPLLPPSLLYKSWKVLMRRNWIEEKELRTLREQRVSSGREEAEKSNLFCFYASAPTTVARGSMFPACPCVCTYVKDDKSVRTRYFEHDIS